MTDICRFLDGLSRRSAVSDAAIAESEKELMAKLPGDYVEFLRATNGGEGFIGKNAYVAFFRIEELLSMNEAYQVQKYAPGLVVFGSDGGGEAYGFDTRVPQWPIVQVPFVGMAWNVARPAGESFSAFLERLSESE